MASERRQEQVTNLMREELARIIARDVELPVGVFLTVTRVAASSDLHYATVFISLLGEDAADALDMLEKGVYFIQQKLNRVLKMRPVPRIRFAIDRDEFRREQVERSLAKLKKSEEAEKNGVVAK